MIDQCIAKEYINNIFL